MTEHRRKEDLTFWGGADAIARRIWLHLSTLVLLAGIVSTVSAFAVRAMTRTVRQDIAEMRVELQSLSSLQRERAVADSARFVRLVEVVELATAALAEPEGSLEQRSAIAEIRRRRHVLSR